MPACASSEMSDAERLTPSQAPVFCPQTTAPDPIAAAAYFLISSCPLSHTSQAGRYHRHSTEHAVRTSFQNLTGSRLNLAILTSTAKPPVSEARKCHTK